MALEKLPCEILEKIFGYLGVSDRLAASTVCKQWYYGSLYRSIWKDAAVHIGKEKATEGLNLLVDCGRPFSGLVFQDCCQDPDNAQESSALFLHALDVCRVVGNQLNVLRFVECTIFAPDFKQILLQCPNLEHLGIVNCERLFSSRIWFVEPEEYDPLKLSLQNVKELDLSCNSNLTDMFLLGLADIFTNLKSLSLATCHINAKFFYWRFHPYFENNKSSSFHLTPQAIVKFISRFVTKITSLNFDRTDFNDATLTQLADMENLKLKSISLLQCPNLTVRALRYFCQHQKLLKKLLLPCYEYELILVDICTNLPELEELQIVRHLFNRTHDASYSVNTSALCKLVKLELIGCSELILLKFIYSLCTEAYPRLRHVSFCHSKVDDYIFIYLVPFLLNITYLNLSTNNITDRSLIMISTHLVRLQVLKLSHCAAITDCGLTGHYICDPANLVTEEGSDLAFPSLFGDSKVLRWLVFDNDHPIAISNLKGLRELDLSGITNISDEGLQMAVVFRELRNLHIGGSPRITDKGLLALTKNNKSLEVLSLRCCENITENGLTRALRFLPRLKKLEVNACMNLRNHSTYSLLVKQYGASFRSGLAF